MKSGIKDFTSEYIMKSIHYFRCNSCVELIALAQQLPKFIEENCSDNVRVCFVTKYLALHLLTFILLLQYFPDVFKVCISTQ